MPANFFSYRNTNLPVPLPISSATRERHWSTGHGLILLKTCAAFIEKHDLELDTWNNQLDFLEEYDPKAEDIAEIESGVDSAGIAEAKTRAAEPAAQSFHAQVLQRILEGIKAGLSRGQKPRPYRNRDIWMRPKHPAFALEEATTTGYTPLYESAVFYGSLICWSEMRMWKYKESCETVRDS
ncbi:hypothetical protein F5880DRAFT_1615523 [Lentinula raphanica]|nr:hypothetical protein F5880DRAFT_1615523 [Lentinula raphanica]